MVRLSPVGLAAAPVANQLSLLITYREKLCHSFCIDSSTQPLATLQYTTGTPVLNGTTVFVPVTARITVVTGGGCKAKTQLFTEQFYVAFQGQTALPTSVTITSVGRVQGGACVTCGRAQAYSINDSVTITIVPAT
jgi:hypothetical protein